MGSVQVAFCQASGYPTKLLVLSLSGSPNRKPDKRASSGKYLAMGAEGDRLTYSLTTA